MVMSGGTPCITPTPEILPGDFGQSYRSGSGVISPLVEHALGPPHPRHPTMAYTRGFRSLGLKSITPWFYEGWWAQQGSNLMASDEVACARDW